MKKLLVIALVLIAVPAFAQQTLNYSWEDGGTILGSYGNLCCDTNVTGPQVGLQGSTLPSFTCPGAVDGTHYLHIAEDPHYSTPQAYIAWVTGLNDGDIVTAGFYGYDATPDASPSHRIWGGYSTSDDINNYVGSAGGGADYSPGLGWDFITFTWTFLGGDGNALVIQDRLYSTPTTGDPEHTDYFVDDITVTAPLHATIHFPEPVSPVESASWGNIKALYR